MKGSKFAVSTAIWALVSFVSHTCDHLSARKFVKLNFVCADRIHCLNLLHKNSNLRKTYEKIVDIHDLINWVPGPRCRLALFYTLRSVQDLGGFLRQRGICSGSVRCACSALPVGDKRAGDHQADRFRLHVFMNSLGTSATILLRLVYAL